MNLFKYFKKPITVVTHNGSFHADDVFACATLSIWAEKEARRIKIIRTRDQNIIDKADIVVDVGGQYVPEKNRFDHHQPEGAGLKENGIPHASFGLVWKHYGEKICTSEVGEVIEKKMVLPIDAQDNGINIYTPNELGILDYRVGNIIHSFNPTLAEGDKRSYKYFKRALNFAKEILEREIAWNIELVEGTRLVKEAIIKQGEPDILVLESRIDAEEEASKHKNIKMVASKSKASDNWSVIAVRDRLEDYNSRRISFPENWRGLRDEELAKVSGVDGAMFCHRGGWVVKAKTKDAALAMAKKALVDYNTGN